MTIAIPHSFYPGEDLIDSDKVGEAATLLASTHWRLPSVRAIE